MDGTPPCSPQAAAACARLMLVDGEEICRDRCKSSQALKEKNVPPANRIAFSGAFYVMGQVKESEKDFSGALEDYLRTITIFYHDSTAKNGAQQRADALRKDNKNKKTTEQLFVP